MRYLKVHWIHKSATDPVELYSEIDDEGWEVRKIEVFADGTIGCAGPAVAVGPTRLGEMPVPPLEEIAADPQFRPSTITPDEFENIWRKSMSPALGR